MLLELVGYGEHLLDLLARSSRRRSASRSARRRPSCVLGERQPWHRAAEVLLLEIEDQPLLRAHQLVDALVHLAELRVEPLGASVS